MKVLSQNELMQVSGGDCGYILQCAGISALIGAFAMFPLAILAVGIGPSALSPSAATLLIGKFLTQGAMAGAGIGGIIGLGIDTFMPEVQLS